MDNGYDKKYIQRQKRKAILKNIVIALVIIAVICAAILIVIQKRKGIETESSGSASASVQSTAEASSAPSAVPDNSPAPETAAAAAAASWQDDARDTANGYINQQDYAGAIKYLKTVLSEHPDEAEFQTLLQEAQNGYWDEGYTNFQNDQQTGDYSAMLDVISDLQSVLPADEYTAEVSYEDMNAAAAEVCCSSISSSVENLLAGNDFEGARAEIDNALNLFPDNEQLKNLYTTVDDAESARAEALVYTAPETEKAVYNDSITEEGQSVTYTMTAAVTGNYRFDLSNMVNGFKVTVTVYDSQDNRVKWQSGMSTDSGLTASLEAGADYTILVEQYSETGDYTLTIGVPKETADITDYTTVNDALVFCDQENLYTFTPEISGIYRFDFSEIQNGFTIYTEVLNDLEYPVAKQSGMSNNSGLTAELDAGTQYTIRVTTYKGTGSYIMSIGKQTATKNLENVNTDEITFTDQKNNYTFTPEASGTYNFAFSEMESGFNVYLGIYNHLNEKVLRNCMESDDTVSVDLETGEEYTIVIEQNDGTGAYTMTVTEGSGES